MTREIIEITDHDQWLGLRKNDVTSTMSPALFDLSPYMTKFELYHAKKSGVEIPFKENDRMHKGTRMEQYAAQEVAIKQGWTVRPLNIYARIPEARMGTSFDYEVTCPVRGKGILELKAVDYRQHKQKWVDGEAPEHIEIQLQHQLECADCYEWGVIAAFTGIYDFHLYARERDRGMGANIVKAIKGFWHDVETGNEPSPDYARDGEVIDALYAGADGETLDMSADDSFDMLLSKFPRLRDEEQAAKQEKEATRSEILYLVGSHTGAYTERYKLNAKFTKDTKGTLVTPEMVGTTIGARKGYRQCQVTDLTKEKGE